MAVVEVVGKAAVWRGGGCWDGGGSGGKKRGQVGQRCIQVTKLRQLLSISTEFLLIFIDFS